MEIYKDTNNDSGISQYELGDEYIIVKFKKKNRSGIDTYKYTYSSVGSTAVEEMQRLAICGNGLNSYISKYVKKNYQSKW